VGAYFGAVDVEDVMKNLVLALVVSLGLAACDNGSGLPGGVDAMDAGADADAGGEARVGVDAGSVQIDADPRPCTEYHWVVNGDYPDGILVCATHEPWQQCNDVLPCTARIDAGTR
jgi:hypothetical protein